MGNPEKQPIPSIEAILQETAAQFDLMGNHFTERLLNTQSEASALMQAAGRIWTGLQCVRQGIHFSRD